MAMRNSSRWKAQWEAQLSVAAILAALAFVLISGATPASALESTSHLFSLGDPSAASAGCFTPVTLLPAGPAPVKPPSRELDPRPAAPPPCRP
jgi:hypothetical protein